MPRFEYSRWDGTQVGYDFDAEDVLAEITDDRVAVYGERGRRTGGFREIEVEVYGEGRAGRRLIRAAISRLVAAGCRAAGLPAGRPGEMR